jgi:hypothetical protein
MDRTYWALALGCNQAILDAVQREWFRQQSSVATFLSIVEYLNFVAEPDRYAPHVVVNSDNYEAIFNALRQTKRPYNELYWHRAHRLTLEVHDDYFCINACCTTRNLLVGDGKDWIYRLPAIFDKL